MKQTREQRLAKRREWYHRMHPDAAYGRGHGRHKTSLSHMTTDERKAHRMAMQAKWREEHRDSYREYYAKHREEIIARTREYRRTHREEIREYDRMRGKTRKRKSRILMLKKWMKENPDRMREVRRRNHRKYREQNYQRELQRSRERSRKMRDKTRKVEYRPRLSRRIPEWVRTPQEARRLQIIGELRMMRESIGWREAINQGLTIRKGMAK